VSVSVAEMAIGVVVGVWFVVLASAMWVAGRWFVAWPAYCVGQALNLSAHVVPTVWRRVSLASLQYGAADVERCC